MLEIPIKLSKRITVGPQPSEEELKDLSKKGFATIVNLSTRGEMDLLYNPAEEGEKVMERGMEYLHFPVSLSRLKPEQATEFMDLFNELPEPIYIHCRIGQRCVPFGLVAYAKKRKLKAEAAFNRCEKLGISFDAPIISSFVKRCLGEGEEYTM